MICKHLNCIDCPDGIIVWNHETIKYILDNSIHTKPHHQSFDCYDYCTVKNGYPKQKELLDI